MSEPLFSHSAHDDSAFKDPGLGDGLTLQLHLKTADVVTATLKMRAGSILSSHTHPHPELIIIEQGPAYACIGAERVFRKVEAGSYILIPAGVPHALAAPINSGAAIHAIFYDLPEGGLGRDFKGKSWSPLTLDEQILSLPSNEQALGVSFCNFDGLLAPNPNEVGLDLKVALDVDILSTGRIGYMSGQCLPPHTHNTWEVIINMHSSPDSGHVLYKEKGETKLVEAFPGSHLYLAKGLAHGWFCRGGGFSMLWIYGGSLATAGRNYVGQDQSEFRSFAKTLHEDHKATPPEIFG
jgi:quercetin dioxygenase-like cupin family protein